MDSTLGERIIVKELERRAKLTPNKVITSYPTSNSLDQFRDVTFAEFVKALDRTCAYLEPIIGRSTTFDTQTYFGPPDLRYHFFILACMLLGHKTLCSAPRNSAVIHLHLLKETQCKNIFISKEIDIAALLGQQPSDGTKVYNFPDLESLLWDSEEPKHYEYTKSYQEAKDDPWLVLHTSGTTGMVKPVIHRHGYLAALDWLTNWKGEDGRQSMPFLLGADSRRYYAFPPWHASGAHLCSLVPQIFGNSVFVWGPTNRLPSSADVIKACENGRAHEICLPAQTYQDLILYDRGMELLTKMKAAWYGGGMSPKR